MGELSIQGEVVARLRGAIEDHRRKQARRAGWERRFIPTGLAPLDAALPHGGLPTGAVTEVISDGAGVGAMTLVMRAVGKSSERRSVETPDAEGIGRFHVVFIDTLGDFYPPAVVAFGLSLDRLIVVRPRSEQDALWAMDQALRCSGVGAVIAPLRRVDERASRRLQLAAESSGVPGFILRSARDRARTFAAVRMKVDCRLPIANCQWGKGSSTSFHQSSIVNWQSAIPRLCHITLLKVREGRPVGPILVDLHHETGDGSLRSVPYNRSAAG